MDLLKVEHEEKAISEEIDSKQDQKNVQQDKNSQYNSGPWTEQEQQRYIFFTDFHRKEFNSKHIRKLGKIFKNMGLFIQTRDGVQCRSHHMKQLKAYRNLDYIIKKYKKNIGATLYFQRFQNIKSDLARYPLQSLLPTNLKTKNTPPSQGKVEQASQTEISSVKIENPQMQLPSLSTSMLPMLQPQNIFYWNWPSHPGQAFPYNPNPQ